MHEAHDALMCIGQKTYINDSNRLKLSNQHYLKSSDEMKELFKDLPEALENNFILPYRCDYRPLPSKPILPNISSENKNNNQILEKDSLEGLKEKFKLIFSTLYFLAKADWQSFLVSLILLIVNIISSKFSSNTKHLRGG